MELCRWVSKQRFYLEETTNDKIQTDVKSHPLLNSQFKDVVNNQAMMKKQVSVSYTDPLSKALEGLDPLSQFSSAKDDEEGENMKTISTKQEKKMDEVSQEWLKHRTTILSKFTTTEKLSITSSFLQGGEKLVVKQQINDKMKHRLQQLDEFEENVSEHKGLSRDDYVTRITQISHELHHAWALDQRVKALKIVIQCSKLLLETHPFAFYPSKFALITDILDSFGRMVFERIADKGDIRLVDHQLPKHFKPEYVPEAARETCRNWMYKIASVRELLPRIYVEMAVLKSYSFLADTNFSEILTRLSRSIRGIGNPLVAVYARCYLMRVGREKFIHDQSFVVDNVTDFLLSYPQLYSASLQTELTVFRTDLAQYLSLYSPALDWMMQALTRFGQYKSLDAVWQQCFNLTESGLLWLSIMSQFPEDFVYARCLELALCITTTPSAGVPASQIMTLMGQILSSSTSTSSENKPVKMLQIVWPYMAQLENIDAYVNCTEAWMPYLIRNWRSKEIHRIINEIVDHLRPKAQPHHVPHLNNIVHAVIRSDQIDYQSLFSKDCLVGLLEVYPDNQSKAEAAKILLQFLVNYDKLLTKSAVVENLLHFGRILHDTLNAQSVEDEKRQIGELAISLIEKVDFGRDFQQMLSFYGDARAAFTNLDPVLAHLVQMINRLSNRTRQMVKEHNERTGHFVRACGAFAYITIPAIACPMIRFDLYLLSSQVALTNECLGQADACLEGAINLVSELSPSDEQWIISSLSNLLSTLLIQPDTPGQSRLHHFRRLLRNVKAFSTNHSLPRLRSTIFIQALRLLSAYSQTTYLYHVPNVESNDRLYIGDEEFKVELADHSSQLLTELLNDIKQLGVEHQYRLQASLCLDIFSCLVGSADLDQPHLSKLAAQLYRTAVKHGQLDRDYATRLLELVHSRAALVNSNASAFRQLASSLS